MKLPINWLKKYIDVKLSPEKLAEVLTMSGTAVERVEKHGGDFVLEIEVTTNRPDCLSLLGLAREVSALTGKKVKFPRHSEEPKATKNLGFEIPACPAGRLRRSPQDDMPKISIEAKKSCLKYTARVIQNVTIKESPSEIKKYLEASGVRVISNIVDATNFVPLETGQPLHAFDLDKLKGRMIVVRFAKKDEKFIGLDDVEYTLDEKTLVIADAERPVAIAGVMGGKLTEVSPSTKNILLESAYFDPATVRQAARKYKLSTESSYRFERGVDIENVVLASARARDLILEWGGGNESGKVLEAGSPVRTQKKTIVLRVERMKNILGLAIHQARAVSILKNLGFAAKPSGKGKISVPTMNSRRDVTQEADLIEEVLRIEGFDKVPTAIPVTCHAGTTVEDRKAVKVLELKKLLAGLGFNEVLTYSFLSQRSLAQSGFTGFSLAQKLKNPVSADHEFLRPTLLPGMLNAILFNVHRKATALRFFEIGNRYFDGREETVLALALYGEWENHWSKKCAATFFDLKGVAENILGSLKISSYSWKEEEPGSIFDYSSALEAGGLKLGPAGAVHADILKNWDIPHEVFYLEWPLDRLLTDAALEKNFRLKPMPKFPVVRRDTAFIIDSAVPVKTLEELMMETASPYIKEARLFDEYKGKNIPAGKRSLAFSLAYQKDNGTFTEEEINALQKNIGEALKEKYHVEFR